MIARWRRGKQRKGRRNDLTSTGNSPQVRVTRTHDLAVCGARHGTRHVVRAVGRVVRRSHRGEVTVYPGDFVLASTIERFCIPNDVLIVAHDKSSWARRGLAVQNTIFDPGWRGYATLELTNHGRSSLSILAGDPIAQVVCHLLTEPTRQPYGINGTGKYQDQEASPQPARDDGGSR